MGTTAVQDRAFPSSTDGGLTELKKYLRLDPNDSSDDFVLDLALDAAKEEADNYTNNPFTDSDGNPTEIPSKVELGVLVWASVVAHREAPELASESARDISESFRNPSEAESEIQKKYWSTYRKSPGL